MMKVFFIKGKNGKLQQPDVMMIKNIHQEKHDNI